VTGANLEESLFRLVANDHYKDLTDYRYLTQSDDALVVPGYEDSTFGYSGATPSEKITWDKLTESTAMFVIESDATIVAPLILRALLEYRRHPEGARKLIAKFA
jgi:hypothetical protein